NAGGVQFEATGGPLEKAEQAGFGAAEGIGLLAAVIILLVAFGSLLAMGLPIVTALFGIGIGISLIGLIGHLLDVPSFAPQVASITLLPAVLGFAGHNIGRFRLPGTHRVTAGERSLSYRWSRVVQHRPWPAALLGATVLIVLALPLFGMRLGSADQGNNPKEF